jgi:hypothetical protein
VNKTDVVPNEEAGLETLLRPFLEANPTASLNTEAFGFPAVLGPWGDASIAFRVDEGRSELLDALNGVILPPTFSALYHPEEQSYEFTWSAFKSDTSEELGWIGRSFDVHFGAETIKCEWAPSSSKLLEIVRATILRESSSSNWRNLYNYMEYVRDADGGKAEPEGTPVSFWVRGVDRDEDRFSTIARHINFLMAYYDRDTPVVVFHNPAPAERIGQRPRYSAGEFPGVLVLPQPLDPYLLGLWDTARTQNDVFLRFLYSYMILEYAAYYFLKRDTAESIRRILSQPAVCANPNATMAQILGVLGREKDMEREPATKLSDLVMEIASCEAVWRAIEPNRESLCEEMAFEGGFVLKPILKPGDGLSDFKKVGWPNLAHRLRHLRNALVHSKETHEGGVLEPTKGNYHRVRIWLEPLTVIAAEIVLSSTADEEL